MPNPSARTVCSEQGKWLQGEGKNLYGKLPVFRGMRIRAHRIPQSGRQCRQDDQRPPARSLRALERDGFGLPLLTSILQS